MPTITTIIGGVSARLSAPMPDYVVTLNIGDKVQVHIDKPAFLAFTQSLLAIVDAILGDEDTEPDTRPEGRAA